jgi:hypothetical protein
VIRFLFLILAASAVHAGSLVEMTQPDGSVSAVGMTSEAWGVSYTFPPGSVTENSWIILPPGLISETILSTSTRNVVLSIPTIHAPDVETAVEVPAGLLSLSLRGSVGNGRLRQVTSRPIGQGTWITRTEDDVGISLPAWSNPGAVGAVTLRRSDNLPWKASFSDGSARNRTFEFRSEVQEWNFFPAAWGFQPRQITISASDAGRFDLSVRAYGPKADLPADPATLLTWPTHAWRSPKREWFAWAGTSVLVLVTADYSVQDDYLKRLAFFVEKTGYRGRLVTDAEVSRLHGWNAHDYAAPDLARFYSLAAEQHFPLNPSEIELRDRLVNAGILIESARHWEPGVGALVGISADSAPALRAVLFVHEAFHGLYYTSAAFRAGVKDTWDAMSEETREAFRSFLALSRYDPKDEALMVNEFQAYTLQRRAIDWPSFFRDRVLSSETPNAAARLAEFLNAAQAIDALVKKLYGLHSGDISLLKVSTVP